MPFFLLNSSVNIMSVIFQRICCSYYRFQDMRDLNALMPCFFLTYVKSNFNGVFFLSNILMKFLPALFKQILLSNDCCHIIRILSKTGEGRKPCCIH